MKKSEALQQRKILLKVVKEWIRADVMLLYGERFDDLSFLEFINTKIQKAAEIRQVVYGESELGKVAKLLGLTKNVPEERRKKKRNNKDVEKKPKK